MYQMVENKKKEKYLSIAATESLPILQVDFTTDSKTWISGFTWYHLMHGIAKHR